MENNEGLNLPSALDSINRNDYKSEAAYLEAAADIELKRSSPEFQKALQKTRAEYAQREYKRQSEERAAILEEEIKHTHLSEAEDKAVLERASNEVADAIRSGKINTVSTQDEINKRYTAYSREEVRRKALRTISNKALRETLGK